jgi:hypothetical protein
MTAIASAGFTCSARSFTVFRWVVAAWQPVAQLEDDVALWAGGSSVWQDVCQAGGEGDWISHHGRRLRSCASRPVLRTARRGRSVQELNARA